MYELYPGEPDENKIYLNPEFRELLVRAHYPPEVIDELIKYSMIGACEVMFDDEGDLGEITYELPPHTHN